VELVSGRWLVQFTACGCSRHRSLRIRHGILASSGCSVGPIVRRVSADVFADGFVAQEEPVKYEFQRGGNRMLRVKSLDPERVLGRS
jgi:hypothetical protein